MKHLLTFFLLLPMWVSGQPAFVKAGKFTSNPERVAWLNTGTTYSVNQIKGSTIQFSTANTGTVEFKLTGKLTWTQRETTAPYLLFGDVASNATGPRTAWAVGKYELRITQNNVTQVIAFYVVETISNRQAIDFYGISNDSVFYKGSVQAPDNGKFVVKYGLDSLVLSWASNLAPPIQEPPIITPPVVVPPVVTPPVFIPPVKPTPGLLVYDSLKHKFLAPDGNYYPDVRGAGVQWAKLDTASWQVIPVPLGASDADLKTLVDQADNATPGGVLLFSKGSYSIPNAFYLQSRTNVIFRGADREETVLTFTKPPGNDFSLFQTKETDSGARLKATQTTKAFTNRVYLSPTDLSRWKNELQPGKYIVCYADVPTYWQGKYQLWSNPAGKVRTWNRQIFQIAEFNQSGGYIVTTDLFPVDMEIGIAGFTVQPITPSTGIGIENMTIVSPKAVAYSQVISFYRAFNVWATNLNIYQPIGYAADFKETSHGEFTYSYVAPMQEIEKGAHGYGGLTGGANILIDSVQWDHPRHGPVTNGGVSGSVFRRLIFNGTDWQTSHDGWQFNSLFEEIVQEKEWGPKTGQIRYEPTTVKFGVNASNVQHTGGPLDCAFYRMVSRRSQSQYAGRMVMVGMGTSGTVVSHSVFEGSLDENYAVTAMIQVWDQTGPEPITFSDCRFILDKSKRPRQKYDPYLIDIVPGTAYNAPGNWPIFQSAFRSYLGIQNGEYIPGNYKDLPAVPSNARVILRNIECVNMTAGRFFTGYNGQLPEVATNITNGTNTNTDIPPGIPGIPSMYLAQKSY